MIEGNLLKFNYYRFTCLEDLLKFLYENPDSKLLAGGTDLIVQMRSKKIKPDKIVDISRVSELRYIEEDKDSIKIGALTTIEELKNSVIIKKWAPPLWTAVKDFATWQVRNIATIGGNICNASPAADTAPPLIVLRSKLRLRDLKGQRLVKVEEFFKGPGETIIKDGEVLTEVVIPKYEEGWRFSFIKLGKRVSHILSIVNVAVGLKRAEGKIQDIIVALGSVAPTPIRSRSVEEYLKDREATYENIDRASLEVVKDIKPISDVRASAEYRVEMSKVLVRRALRECLTS
ncbi:MAG: xanthine dehydrogenase family protein subunit M [Aigarchaeota archaeon]|nr:xanthine dehydrogenase family protein subunit M [Aigarchaeota archaeon]MCX8193336.1 xanthine dehydrogenase family protein subunit M [Nitrososphaeria archaeon]MDW7985866.1 xanthine dehydrogenase family protein subunit M [Nitrososphaerota archaeon]